MHKHIGSFIESTVELVMKIVICTIVLTWFVLCSVSFLSLCSYVATIH